MLGRCVLRMDHYCIWVLNTGKALSHPIVYFRAIMNTLQQPRSRPVHLRIWKWRCSHSKNGFMVFHNELHMNTTLDDHDLP